MICVPLKNARRSASRIFFGSVTSRMNCSLKRRYSASYPEPVFFFFCAGFCFGVGRPFVTFSPACRGGGFLLKNPSGYRQAIPTCPVVRMIYESCYSMILIASSRIFRAAFTSRSCNTPHDGHAHSRTLKSLTRGFLQPQSWHSWLDGYHLST